MFVERRINASTGAIELWWCEWEKGEMAGAKKMHADGEDAILYAQVAQLGAELLDDSVARLEQAA
jgi:hypothetical protein